MKTDITKLQSSDKIHATKADIARLDERVKDVEAKHDKIPDIWKTINSIKSDIVGITKDIEYMTHDHRNTKAAQKQMFDTLLSIEKQLNKLIK